MNLLLKVVGWTLRASAAICITFVVVSVARGAAGFTTVPEVLGSVAWHAAFALGGVQLVGLAKRREAASALQAVAEA
jgi:hypothetical protein